MPGARNPNRLSWVLHCRHLSVFPATLLPLALLASILAGYVSGFAQQAYDPDVVLLSVRDRLLSEQERLPRYTCVQTVTRRYYRSERHMLTPSCANLIAAHDERNHELPLLSWDRLRMEVAIVDGQNVFSWVGAPRFEEGTLEELASGGPLGSGDFGPFLSSILRRALISFKEEQAAHGKHLLLYTYQMPLIRSSYQIKSENGWVKTGYSGALLLDPVDSDIATLIIRSDELPKSTLVCQTNSEIDYSRVAIHDRAILIPRQTRLGIIDTTGGETLSTTEYSKCREYASKSRMLSAAPQDRPATTLAAPDASALGVSALDLATMGRLPAGLHFQGRIVTPVDSETAAAGDLIDVVLHKPLRDAQNRPIASAGTLLHARLKLVKHLVTGFTQITLQFDTIELNGANIPLRASPDAVPQPLSRSVGSMLVSGDPASIDTTSLVFHGEHLHFRQFDWGWTTLPPDLTSLR